MKLDVQSKMPSIVYIGKMGVEISKEGKKPASENKIIRAENALKATSMALRKKIFEIKYGLKSNAIERMSVASNQWVELPKALAKGVHIYQHGEGNAHFTCRFDPGGERYFHYHPDRYQLIIIKHGDLTENITQKTIYGGQYLVIDAGIAHFCNTVNGCEFDLYYEKTSDKIFDIVRGFGYSV